jgi:hypothetical protein
MKERESVDGDVMLVEPVNLGKAPGGMDLIAMGQADQLGTPGRSAGVKQRAHRRSVGAERKVQFIALPGKLAAQAAIFFA